MCIIFLGKNSNGLFITFNRDEYLLRETEPFKIIDEVYASSKNYSKEIFYSEDKSTGGTFFAFNRRTFDFCFLLNHAFKNFTYNPNTKFKRGEIPLLFCSFNDFDKNKIPESSAYIKGISQFIESLKEMDSDFNGYNIVFGNLYLEEIFYYTNNKSYIQLSKNDVSLPLKLSFKSSLDVYGVNNRFLNEPHPKITLGINTIKDLIKEDKEEIIVDLFNKVMCNKSKFYSNDKIEEIAKASSSENVISLIDPELHEVKHYVTSSIFVENNYKDKVFLNYGTRQSYLIQTQTSKDHKKKSISIYENFGKVNKKENSEIYCIDDVEYSKGYCLSLSIEIA